MSTSNLILCLFVGLLTAAPAAALEPGRLYTRGPSEQKQIALSFDDGPGPETPKLLALLDRYSVKATFFVLGEAVQARTDLLRDLARRGHEIASHTTSHRNYLQHQRSLSAKLTEGGRMHLVGEGPFEARVESAVAARLLSPTEAEDLLAAERSRLEVLRVDAV